MSAATLDDYSTQDLTKEKTQVQAERTRILNMVSRKAQEQTLTLQETTALYEKFNRTYSEYRSNEPQEVDESWALALLEESEREEITSSLENTAFQTRINGIPHEAKQSPGTSGQANNTSPANDDILVDEKPQFESSAPFISQSLNFEINDHFSTPEKSKHHKAFITFIVASCVVTLSALVGFSIFF